MDHIKRSAFIGAVLLALSRTLRPQSLPQIVATLQPQLDVFDVPRSSYLLARVPCSAPDVYLNGLLQRAGYDYTLSGQTLTFALPTAEMQEVCIQVRYWV